MKTRNKDQEAVKTLDQFGTKPEEAPKPQPTEEREPTRVLLSDTDAYIHDRMKGQPKTLSDVEVQERKQPDEWHRLTLPPELKRFESRFAFRWLFKHPQAISQACDVRGWVLVNRTHFDSLPIHLFTANGSIERGDSILAFMPLDRAKKIREESGRKSTEAVRARLTAHENDPNFYKPKEEGENIVMI